MRFDQCTARAVLRRHARGSDRVGHRWKRALDAVQPSASKVRDWRKRASEAEQVRQHLVGNVARRLAEDSYLTIAAAEHVADAILNMGR